MCAFPELRRTTICVASGPSLSDDQCEIAEGAQRRRDCSVIAINDNWRRVPNADVLYACDGAWWEMHSVAVRQSFRGQCWTQDAKAAKLRPWLSVIGVIRRPGLTTDPARICLGGNGGHQAINLAYLFGARRILLIGYDMQNTGGRAHWFGDHPKPLTQGHPRSFIAAFSTLAEEAALRDLDIINCSVESALTCFQRMTLAEALAA